MPNGTGEGRGDVVDTTDMQPRYVRLMNRLHARRAAKARPAAGFLSTPEPRIIGHFARGRQLLAGNFLFFGHLVEAPGVSLWDAAARVSTSTNTAHGFAWLDDLAAVGDAKARGTAQAWVRDWITHYGDGRSAGWTPDLTGRRLIRWIAHGFFLLRGADSEFSNAYFRSAAQQAIFLSRRWHAARHGLPRFEALAGMIYAGLSLQGMEGRVEPAVAALAKECEAQIAPDGGIASRNPEDLMQVLTLLTWVNTALTHAKRDVPNAVRAAMARIAPALRALRHADGGLARFHGGGRGVEGWLDLALAGAGTRDQPGEGLRMGFGHLTAGRTSVIVDAAPPPFGRVDADAHASTLAFELTSGRCPLIVNCGSGAHFGPEWRRAGRATPSHSTLSIERASSARSGAGEGGADLLRDGPVEVQSKVSALSGGTRLEMAQDGYRAGLGLTHVRTLDLGRDGRALAGEDLLTTLEDADDRLFDAALDARRLQGIAWSVRFHLHPEVDAVVDLGGSAVSLTQRSGEIWVFRHDGVGTLRLDPSVYLETGRLRPRATQQVVLSGTTMDYATRIRWSLSKAQDTPILRRDPREDDAHVDD